MQTSDYARWFRGSTPYISAHRNKTFVVLLPGEALAHTNLTNIVHDLALLHVLGVKLVLVHGARPQIDTALAGEALRFHGHRRVTSPEAMEKVAGVAGALRARLEALFSTGLPNTPMHNVDIPVVSGNFVTAQPVGILDGVDHECTGLVRRVQRGRVQATLEAGAVLLQSPIGYSSSGQVFNLAAEELAAELATQLNAEKFIVFDDFIVTGQDGARVSTLTPVTLEQALEDHPPERQNRLRALIRAVRGGVRKAQLVNFEQDGALLAELFTAAGVGTQVLEEQRQPIREAVERDVPEIVEVLRPLEQAGVLVRRERDGLEQDIDRFLVAELDGIVVGCCAVYPYGAQAELACVAVHENYRGLASGSLGEALLAAAEERARQAGAQSLFVLTTQTQDWFREHGFDDAAPDSLPDEKQSLYNWQRNSAVLSKAL